MLNSYKKLTAKPFAIQARKNILGDIGSSGKLNITNISTAKDLEQVKFITKGAKCVIYFG